ncbi:hypothetical protein PUR71_10800 [Streptomyces sp. SP17BM10]|uniref:hypothetical protein n=1 Tax=Streptomyces sp. SP17BM10 TaxID=3002530 RepID=UPI002E790642|nr:hypothetical protein [Streptomyces sp. SP17BM10]MEE1783399.1 hypothetical protein [Streptomyces sp. SP17BM10]
MSTTPQLDLTAEDEAEMMGYRPPESDAELISGRKASVLATAHALPRLVLLALRLGRQADPGSLTIMLSPRRRAPSTCWPSPA